VARGATRTGALLLIAFVALAVSAATWWIARREAGPRLQSVPLPEATASRSMDGASPPPDVERRVESLSPSPGAPRTEEEIAAIESRGRLLLFGEVVDSAGAPCADAVIWHAARPIARSDAAGRYEVEIDRDEPATGCDVDWQLLTAVKEGVGSGAARFGSLSERLDLVLAWRARLSGTTLDAATRAPVAGARIELGALPHCAFGLAPIWTLATLSDERGAFEFADLPPTAVALRATAERFASAGWSVRSLDDGDASGVEFLLMRRVQLRGRFEPWPLAGDADAGTTARVVATPTRRGDVWPSLERLEVPVLRDGTFALPVAESFDCLVTLHVGGGVPWSREFEVPVDGGDVDLGTIELPEPAWIEVDLSERLELVEFGVEASAWVVAPPGIGGCQRRLDGNGRARLGPFDGRQLRLSLSFAGERGPLIPFVDVDPLRPGEVRRIAPPPLPPHASGFLVGRCVDADGAPATGVVLELAIPWEERLQRFSTSSDRAGRFVLDTPPRVGTRLLARGRSIELIARGRRGVARVAVAEPLPQGGAIRRVDVTLAPSHGLRGRVFDAAGAPVADADFELHALAPDGTLEQAGAIERVLQRDGRFSIDALEARDFAARVWLGERWADLGRVRPGVEPVTLRVANED